MSKSLITRKPVKSSNIASVGYDATSSTLSVAFKDGGVYHYAGVSGEHATGMQSAESAGKYFHSHIKGKFPHTQHE